MNRVDVNAGDLPLPPWAEASGRFARRVLEELGRDGWNLSVLYCGDPFIRDLNSRYRNLDEATDILSFPQGEGPGIPGVPDEVTAGDLVISLDTLAENARYFGVSVDEELRRLLIHGILHLDGMDHATNNETEPMLRLQESLLTSLAGERIIP
jgi:probable rRNA maturation factor